MSNSILETNGSAPVEYVLNPSSQTKQESSVMNVILVTTRSVVILNHSCMTSFPNSSLTWICSQCGLPNFSNSFFNESINSLDSPNTFALLDETMANRATLSQNGGQIHCRSKDKHHLKTSKCKLTCLVVNCQSIRNKVADIAAITEEYKPDIILGNES